MNRLSNGAFAVGSENSWMRLQVAYEHELENANILLRQNETVSHRAELIMTGLMNGKALLGNLLKNAAIACGIKPIEKEIIAYLKAAKQNNS